MKKIPISALDIFQLLKGVWSISRKFDNQIETYLSGYASGTTTIKADNKTILLYNETSQTLFNNGVKSTGATAYKFKIEQTQLHQYLIASAKEEHMFKLNFFAYKGRKAAKANYICGKDLYNVTYIFASDDQFQITYKVTGPRKNYITQTTFERSLTN